MGVLIVIRARINKNTFEGGRFFKRGCLLEGGTRGLNQIITVKSVHDNDTKSHFSLLPIERF